MHLITTLISLLFSCCLWEVETQQVSTGYRQVTDTLSVSNGGQWGEWGKEEYCPIGYLDGISLKMEDKNERIGDKTGVVGIRGYCSDGSVITSTVGKGGDWSSKISCPSGYLRRFSLRVLAPRGKILDDTAATDVKFQCMDGSEMEGDGLWRGKWGEWSKTCRAGETCGIVTKVENAKGLHLLDHTELNDVKFFCCK